MLDGEYKATMNNFALHTSRTLQPVLTCLLVVILPVGGCTAATSEELHAPTALSSQQGPPSFYFELFLELAGNSKRDAEQEYVHVCVTMRRLGDLRACSLPTPTPGNFLTHF